MDVISELHAPNAFQQGKLPQYALNRRLVGLQSRSGCFGEEINHLPYQESNTVPWPFSL
jgi:hypothetical protein